jgi:hypothetical protein
VCRPSIVAKIGPLFAQADAIERAVAIARQRADKIDQAILARAFRGELRGAEIPRAVATSAPSNSNSSSTA